MGPSPWFSWRKGIFRGSQGRLCGRHLADVRNRRLSALKKWMWPFATNRFQSESKFSRVRVFKSDCDRRGTCPFQIGWPAVPKSEDFETVEALEIGELLFSTRGPGIYISIYIYTISISISISINIYIYLYLYIYIYIIIYYIYI